MRWQQQGEITRFDIREHGAEALKLQGWAAVVSSRPANEIAPGMQSYAWIDRGNEVRAEFTGVVTGDHNLYYAAARVVLQATYRFGLLPGHAGIYTDTDSRPEALASPDSISRITSQVGKGYIGYFCMTEAGLFEDRSPAEVGGALITRKILPVRELVGVTVADANILLGASGLDGLRDPVHHPFVRGQLAAAGLRPDMTA